MYLQLRDFLAPHEVARMREIARVMPFVEGRASNPHNITKSNLQADVRDAGHAEVSRMGLAAFARSREFQDFALPKKIAPPLLARYEPGMKYGPHADLAFMRMDTEAGLTRLRSDLSCTVFLNDPESYDGGELVLHLGTHPVAIKAMPGEAFVYPSTTLHEVSPVRSGQRLVMITFIESLIPDEQERNTVVELKEVLALEGLRMDWNSRVRMEVVIQNLTRQWAQP